MPTIETIKSVVNAWECDKNGHLNARFYSARFEDATRCFLHQQGLDVQEMAPRHLLIRFHSESREGQLLSIDSAFLTASPWPNAIGHRLVSTSDGRLIASALILIDELASLPENRTGQFQRDYEPRLEEPRVSEMVLREDINQKKIRELDGFVSAKGVIQPEGADSDGNALERSHVGLFSDGAAHVWESLGLESLPDSGGYGRAVAELSITIRAPIRVGDTVEQLSRITDIRSRTITMRHYQFNAGTGELCAMSEAVGMMMNLETRRAVSIPEHVRNEFSGSGRSSG